jgi:hypothetical protein
MSKIGEPEVRFLSPSLLQTSRGGLLLAESVLFTLPSLLFVADLGHSSAPLLFFLLSARFATSLTFVFCLFPQLLTSCASSPASAEPFHGRQRVACCSPATSSIPPKNQTRTPLALKQKSSLSTGIPAAVSKQALRQQENIAEEHAAIALVAAKKKRSVSNKDIVKPRA